MREGIQLHAGGDNLISEGCVVVPKSQWEGPNGLKAAVEKSIKSGKHPRINIDKSGASITDDDTPKESTTTKPPTPDVTGKTTDTAPRAELVHPTDSILSAIKDTAYHALGISTGSKVATFIEHERAANIAAMATNSAITPKTTGGDVLQSLHSTIKDSVLGAPRAELVNSHLPGGHDKVPLPFTQAALQKRLKDNYPASVSHAQTVAATEHHAEKEERHRHLRAHLHVAEKQDKHLEKANEISKELLHHLKHHHKTIHHHLQHLKAKDWVGPDAHSKDPKHAGADTLATV